MSCFEREFFHSLIYLQRSPYFHDKRRAKIRATRKSTSLIRKHFSSWGALEFGQSIFHRNSLCFIVDMKRWFKCEILQYCSVDIHQCYFRVVRHQVSSALSTKLSVCVLSLVEGADMIFPLDYFDTFLWPKSGCSDGGGRPGRAVFAVTVAHHCRSP